VKRWWAFIRERFDPFSHTSMILVYIAAHFTATGEVPRSPLKPLLIIAGTGLFFFKLRLYDEIKDYEFDLRFNPQRPLARGLVKHRELYLFIGTCIAVELATFALLGPGALLAMTAAIAYSLLMFKEFFISGLLRPRMTLYAVSHTAVSALLTIALLSGIRGLAPWALPTSDALFALNSWALFSLFEFGRKTFTAAEERQYIGSYSKSFGRFGAVILAASMALTSYLLLGRIPLFAVQVMALALLGFIFAVKNRDPYGRIYRFFTSFYIVLVYVEYTIIGFRAI
jgi:4-hydroxybenzoate polyprenyltransferase